jgi:hypothetical protein
MGVVAPSRKSSSTVTRKRSTDFSKLGPLKNQGTKGFSSYRDPAARATRKGSKHADAMDSDEDDEEPGARDEMDDVDVKDENGNPLILTEEDRQRQEEMAEGVRHIKVCCYFPSMMSCITNSSTAQAPALGRVQQPYPQQISSCRCFKGKHHRRHHLAQRQSQPENSCRALRCIR